MTPTVPTTTVSSQPAQAAPPAATAPPSQAAGGAPAGEDVAAIKAELAALKNEVGETKRTAQFWYEKATTGAREQGPGAGEKKPEPEADVDLLDLITTKGVKGLDELMAKRGYVRGDQVDEKVNSKAAQIAKEGELLGRYPDLKSHDSDFFKATAAEYGDLVKQGVPQHLAMEMAAERAELRGIRSGKMKTPAQQTEDTKAQKEADRLARIKAQGGERGNRAPVESEEDEELTPQQKHIVASMGITEEAYKARAKAGVAMKGVR